MFPIFFVFLSPLLGIKSQKCIALCSIMQEGVFITPQEAMEPVLNEALIDYESSLRLKTVKINLSFPQ